MSLQSALETKRSPKHNPFTKLFEKNEEALATSLVKVINHRTSISLKNDTGVLCFMFNHEIKAYCFELFSIEEKRLIWKHEAHKFLNCRTSKNLLQVFEGKTFVVVDFIFYNEEETNWFFKVFLTKSRQEFSNNTNVKIKNNTKSIGKPINFTHVKHQGTDDGWVGDENILQRVNVLYSKDKQNTNFVQSRKVLVRKSRKTNRAPKPPQSGRASNSSDTTSDVITNHASLHSSHQGIYDLSPEQMTQSSATINKNIEEEKQTTKNSNLKLLVQKPASPLVDSLTTLALDNDTLFIPLRSSNEETKDLTRFTINKSKRPISRSTDYDVPVRRIRGPTKIKKNFQEEIKKIKSAKVQAPTTPKEINKTKSPTATLNQDKLSISPPLPSKNSINEESENHLHQSTTRQELQINESTVVPKAPPLPPPLTQQNFNQSSLNNNLKNFVPTEAVNMVNIIENSTSRNALLESIRNGVNLKSIKDNRSNYKILLLKNPENNSMMASLSKVIKKRNEVMLMSDNEDEYEDEDWSTDV